MKTQLLTFHKVLKVFRESRPSFLILLDPSFHLTVTYQLDERGVERVEVHGEGQLHLDVAVGVLLPQVPQVLAKRA